MKRAYKVTEKLAIRLEQGSPFMLESLSLELNSYRKRNKQSTPFSTPNVSPEGESGKISQDKKKFRYSISGLPSPPGLEKTRDLGQSNMGEILNLIEHEEGACVPFANPVPSPEVSTSERGVRESMGD